MLSDGWDELTRYEKGKAGESLLREALDRVAETHPDDFWFDDNCKENGVARGADFITSHGDIEAKAQSGRYSMRESRFVDNVLARTNGFKPMYLMGFNLNLTPKAQALADEYLAGMLSLPYRVTPRTPHKRSAAKRRFVAFITHVVMHIPKAIVPMTDASGDFSQESNVSSQLHSLVESLRRAIRWMKRGVTTTITRVLAHSWTAKAIPTNAKEVRTTQAQAEKLPRKKEAPEFVVLAEADDVFVQAIVCQEAVHVYSFISYFRPSSP